MSEMSFLEKLLSGAEVKWTSLGDVATIKNGKDWESLGSGDIPVYGPRGVMSYVDTFVYDEPTVLIPRKGSLTNIFYVEEPFWNVDTIYYTKIDKECLVPKFFYYFMKTLDLMSLDTGFGSPRLTQATLNSILVPIPCLDNPEKSLKIQAEIVHILDAFTELTTELITELIAREKQYSYYRNQLFTFSERDVEWKSLGDKDYFGVDSGGTPSKSKLEYWNDGDIPWLESKSCNNNVVFKANNFITNIGLKESSAKLLDAEIALVGDTIFKTAFIEFRAATSQNIASIKSKNSNFILDKFIFYYITNLYEKLKSKMRNYWMLNLTTLKQFKIPVPSLKEQIHIVSILDKFDVLTNSISEGLPREIELRQKQYEYYRDQLFNFPKTENEDLK